MDCKPKQKPLPIHFMMNIYQLYNKSADTLHNVFLLKRSALSSSYISIWLLDWTLLCIIIIYSNFLIVPFLAVWQKTIYIPDNPSGFIRQQHYMAQNTSGYTKCLPILTPPLTFCPITSSRISLSICWAPWASDIADWRSC